MDTIKIYVRMNERRNDVENLHSIIFNVHNKMYTNNKKSAAFLVSNTTKKWHKQKAQF